MQGTVCSCQISVKLEFSRQVFEKKYSDMEFHENPSSWVALRSFAQAPKITNCKDNNRWKDNSKYILQACNIGVRTRFIWHFMETFRGML